jgi:excisionase family DNA binding protein
MAARKKRAPAQTSFLKPAPQIKDNNVLDVAEAAALLKVSKETIYKRVRDNAIPHARLGRKLLFHKQTLTQWVADGGDRASNAGDNDQLSLEQLLNTGQARIASKR